MGMLTCQIVYQQIDDAALIISQEPNAKALSHWEGKSLGRLRAFYSKLCCDFPEV